MKDKEFQALIDQSNWKELEAYWREKMEAGSLDLDDYFEAARMMARNHEKPRAAGLMTALAENLREKQLWMHRLRVLKEIVRHTLDSKKLEDMKEQLREAILNSYPDRPSFANLMRNAAWDQKKTPDELINAVSHVEDCLRFDVGQMFYQQGYGAGIVTEINPKLGVARIDFEKKKDVTVEIGDREVVALEPGHVLREKLESPEEFKKKAEEAPGEILGRILRTFERSMTVSEIKDCLIGAVTPAQWSRWWNAAKKNQQVVATGKGAQAEYSWSDSTAAAEASLKKEFTSSKVPNRISLARQHASRGEDIAGFFLETLLLDARNSYEQKQMDVALEILDLFAKWPGSTTPDPGFTFNDVLQNMEPAALLAKIDGIPMKTRILTALRELFPDRWPAIYVSRLIKEETPKVLDIILQGIQEYSPEKADELISRLLMTPYLHPAGFVWLVERGALETTGSGVVLDKADGRVLIYVIDVIDAQEFTPFRNRIKKAIEGGFLTNLLLRIIDPEQALKAIDRMDNTRWLEDYRRDRWKNFIRSRIPETKIKEDFIFTTKEALERKRLELEHMIKVELPTNRKAVGEAAAHGDLKENHEYKAARERQEYLINRVEVLQGELNRARPLEPGQIDNKEVRPGTKVWLTQEGGKQMELTLLGPWDSNPTEGIYSYQAPVGVLLIGRLPGEKIVWNDESWIVEKIEPWA